MKRQALLGLAVAVLGCNSLVGSEELVASPAESAAGSAGSGAGAAGAGAGQAGTTAGEAGTTSAGASGAATGGAGGAGQAGDAGQAGTSTAGAGQAGTTTAGQAGDGGQAGASAGAGQAGQAGDAGQAGAGQAGTAAGEAGAGQAGSSAGQAGAGQAGSSAGQAGAAGQAGQAGGCATSPISHLVSWWHLDRVVEAGNWSLTTPVGDHHDVMGRNPGKSVGNVSFGPGVRGNGLAGGVNGHVSVPHSASLTLSKISVEAWVTVGAPGPIVSKNTAGFSDAPLLDLPGQSFRFVAGNDAVFGQIKPPPGSTVHVVGTYDGATIKLYVNGVLDGAKAASGAAVQNTLPWRIGADHDPNPHTYGSMIDEVRIWDDALSPEEVVAQHAKTSCAVIDAMHLDLSGHAKYEETCPTWFQMPPTIVEPGFSGFLSHTFNGCGTETVPFLTRFMNDTDRFPYVRFDTTQPFTLDRLTLELTNNFENYKNGQQVTVGLELGPEGETDPLAAGYVLKGVIDEPQPWTSAHSLGFSLGGFAPGKRVVRFRPDVTPEPGSAFLGFGELHVLGTVQ